MKNKNKHTNGWLDRTGKLHYCKFNCHNEKAVKIMEEYKLKKSPEYIGWIKVHSVGVWFFQADQFYGRQYVKITKKQKEWLFKHNYDIKFFL